MRDARELADYMLLKAAKEGYFLTPLHINKLCYLVQGFMLRNAREVAFHNRIEAWQYGPVIPDVYDAFKRYGRSPIRRLYGGGEPVCVGSAQDNGPISMLKKSLGGKISGIADRVVDKYAGVDGGRLVGMTHEKGTPWSDTKRFFSNPVIPTDVIKDYYVNMGPDTVGR